MSIIVSKFARLMLGTTILAAGVTQATAQSVPNLNVEYGCRQVSRGPHKLTTFDNCMEDERSAHDRLTVTWQTFDANDRRVCLEETTSDGTPSYMEFLECLNMAKRAREQMGHGRPL
jgi:hypothetical protein